MSDGVHTNTLVSIVFGVEINKRVIKSLKSVLSGSGVRVNDHVKHIRLKTEDCPPVLQDTYIHTLFAIRYIYKYQISSSHDVRAGITFDNINKWVEAVFVTEEDSGNIKDLIGTVGDRASESEEDLEEADDVLDEE